MLSKRSHAAVSAALLSLAASQSEPPCELPKTGLYEQAGRLCMDGMPDSRTQCLDFLAELASVEDRSLEQALALAFGTSFSVHLEGDYDAESKAQLAGRKVLQPFVDATPDDPMLIYAYASMHMYDDERYRTKSAENPSLYLSQRKPGWALLA